EAFIVLGLLRVGNMPIFCCDGPAYEQTATNLVEHGSISTASSPPFWPTVERTPGYPLFLAIFHLVAPGSVLLVRVAQFGLLLLTGLLVYSIARSLISRRVAFVAAFMCITYLPLVWLATWHLTEVLSAFLIAAIVWLILRLGVKTSQRYLICALIG